MNYCGECGAIESVEYEEEDGEEFPVCTQCGGNDIRFGDEDYGRDR